MLCEIVQDSHKGQQCRPRGKDTQITGDTETDGDFTAALDKKWLFNIKPQHITLKPAGQTESDHESGEAARL